MKLHTMKRFFFICALCFAIGMQAQDSGAKPGGILQVGVRTTSSLFNHDGYPGMGMGGQFRLRLLERLNTDWFADYITTNIGDLGQRTDYHIGWSVLFYPMNYSRTPGTITPYVLAGHCFDYTEVRTLSKDFPTQRISRTSSAIQGGIGMHYDITKYFDLTLNAQYMMHLGEEIHADIENDASDNPYLHLEKEHAAGLEGHMLLTLGLNVRVADLWSR